MSCVIVIPIYKNVPARTECASIRQTFRVLGRHDIVFVTHRDCQLEEYQKIVSSEQGVMRTEFFDKSFFDSTAHYSDLCFSEEFYLRFKKYEYMLICQTDAWVFRDELDYWCGQGYDYIGAPIYFPFNKQKFTRIFYGVGNGGFSLRRIDHCLRIIRADQHKIFLKPGILAKIYWYGFLYNEDYTKSLFKRLGLLPLFIAKVFGFRNSIAQFRKTGCEEDAILSFWAHNAWGLTCRVPDELEAARFSFEVHPEYLYNRTGGKLPFGCHAFEKWEYESFWKKHIVMDNRQRTTDNGQQTMIKFSIITVCYNASATIRETIASVLNQTYQELEYIVVDGKSTDGTVGILQSIDDKRLKFISEKDTGIYDAMNKGLRMAGGDYLIFLGADDTFYDKDVLKKVAAKLTSSNDVVYGDVMLKKRQKLYNGAFTRWTWGHLNISHQSIFYPRSVYTRYQYDERYRSVADWDYNLRLLIDGIRFRYIGETICTFNDADGLSSSSKDRDFLKVRRKMVCRAVGVLPYCWGILQRAKRRLLNEKY